MKNNYINNEAIRANIEKLFQSSDKYIYKARNEIKIVEYKGMSLVVKSFKIPHLINKIAYTFFRDSKAKKSYENSIKIQKFVPKAIAYKEFKKFGLIDKSYFVCEKFKYDFTIRKILLDSNFKNKENIFKEFAQFTYALHESNIEHLDYSPGNILIKAMDGNYIFKIVDVNRMNFKTLNNTQRLESFSKLWAKNEDLKMIVKFYNAYINVDEEEAIKVAIKASQKHKDKKNFKKRLKGIEVVD